MLTLEKLSIDFLTTCIALSGAPDSRVQKEDFGRRRAVCRRSNAQDEHPTPARGLTLTTTTIYLTPTEEEA